MGQVVVTLDCGTHAVRSMAFDVETGASHHCGSEDLQLSFPRPGWVEIDPEHIFNRTVAVLRRAIGWAKVSKHDIACIGLTDMRETAFAWRRSTGEPVYAGVMWMSQQSAPVVQVWQRAGLDEIIRSRTGLGNHTFFFGSKVAWLLQEVPEAARLAAQDDLAIGTVEAWLLYRLTGGHSHLTDVSNASRYQLLNLERLEWDGELCDALDIPMAALPGLAATSADFGRTDPNVCGASLPITGMIADQQASLFGHGCESPGDVKATFGTSGVVAMNTGRSAPLRDGLVTSVAWTLDDGSSYYEIEGSAFHSGYTVGWLTERFNTGGFLLSEVAEGPELAEQRVYILPAFTELGAPRYPEGRGAIIAGLRMDSTPADMLRAAVEAMTFQAYDLFLAMDLPEAAACEEVSVDGGGSANPYLCQLFADLLQHEVVRPTMPELTSVGAAKVALLGAQLPVDRYFGQNRAGATRFQPRRESDYARDGFDRWSQLIDEML